MGGSSIATPLPLTTFSPGSPGEPDWTVLELDIAEHGTSMTFVLELTDIRCPSVWEFILYKGPPAEATPLSGFAVHFTNGQGGAIVHSSGPLPIDVSTVEHDGHERCPMTPVLTVRMGNLPLGTLYLLEFTAGTPFRAKGTVTASAPITVVATTEGSATYYVNASQFSEGSFHAGYRTPASCLPNADPTRGNLAVCGSDHRAGGAVAGVDVGMDRSARLDFERHVYYNFGRTAVVAAGKISVTDPRGDVRYSGATSVDGYSTGSRPILAWSPTTDYPPGTYKFDIHANAEASPGGRFSAYGADFFFPGEEAR